MFRDDRPNLLAVRADHPAEIRDLPWVCGGCSEERGFSEGSQPMGIFRPVHLIVTNPVRIEPFGVHIWNDTTVSEKSAVLNIETEIKNYSKAASSVSVSSRLLARDGKVVLELKAGRSLKAGETAILKQRTPVISNPHLWSLEDPYLYTLVSEVRQNGKLVDQTTTSYGIRWISWPVGRNSNDKRFYLNGKPVFINGIAEYEHLIGNSHAFTAEQIRSRVMQIKAAGFNSFRDAHQPHNLRYQEYWDKMGILWWPQMAAHIWFDNPDFRKNFKQLLTDWVKERRNSPSIILWGLENESTLPEDFARECSDLIRKLDPTASSQRKITTCNGGKGTDWDVPQNWTGTYGGDPATYSEDVKRQVLIGEYGAWRTLDLHTEGPFNQSGAFSEDRMTQLMELKVRLAEAAKANTSGHYFWLFTSHDNPGRVQGGEGLREIDRVGPVNYKGLLTPWEEPLDVYYMFRANYAPGKTDPMVYIVSHTWPDRWIKPGKKDSITVYSNCDEVELFNDVNDQSLGRRTRNGVGTHFQWDGADIRYNVLYAVGYVDGKAVAKDYIVLHHLPAAPHFSALYADAKPVTVPQKGLNYLYRVNCGGPDYKDTNGNVWMADRRQSSPGTWGSKSWTEDFPGIPSFFASQRRTNDPIRGTADWPLFQTFRYGRDKLSYHFPVPDGEYTVELYFTEPWLGTGGGMDCSGWRLFDVAVNGNVVIRNLDIWKEAGHDGALKKTVKVRVTGGQLVLSFPRVASGQALISAVAIASDNLKAKPASASLPLIQHFQAEGAESASFKTGTWLDTGDKLYTDAPTAFATLPSNLYGAEWIQTSSSPGARSASFTSGDVADVFVGLPVSKAVYSWMGGYEDTKSTLSVNSGELFKVYRKRFAKGEQVMLGGGSISEGPFTVAVLPATTLAPAYDLKPVKGYKAPLAVMTGGIEKATVNEKDAVVFRKASGDILEWAISVGVADTYSLTIKYANTSAKNYKAKLVLTAADGTLMKEEIIELAPSKPGKWNYFATSSGTMINAGTYKVKLVAIDAEGLGVSGLDVQ
ncbi:malectin domain-containing carbohydrate-binding protein [Arcticibacter sp. MXS-1]|uniref:malectin domain-containing carbohydrate-binding protein n=1 Tax=Arcticibacter sp. MXS-1 TaxID=3341726 RepID=UPI0035A8806D